MPVGSASTRFAHDFSRIPLGHAPASLVQRSSVQSNVTNVKTDAATEGVGEVLAGAGRPLEATVRRDMERRFGQDFSGVRVHSDRQAARSADALEAQAYTVGSHIVFGAGLYQPHSTAGGRLLAHELAHVVQQKGQSAAPPQTQLKVSTPGDAGEREADAAAEAVMRGQRAPRLAPAPPGVQRKCGRAELGAPAPECTPSEAGVVGWQFLFKLNCDELQPGEETKVSQFTAGSQLNVHGFASLDGDADFNLELSCHRANKIAELARTSRPDCTVAGVFKHGATPQPQPGAVPDANPPSFWRSVIVEEIKAAPEPPAPTSKCGPDATDWLVDQVAAGKRNAKVLEIRQHLDNAAFLAPAIGSPALGLDSTEILEGAVLEKVEEARNAAGRPPRTLDAVNQMSQATPFGPLSFQTAKMAVLGLDAFALATLTELRDASLKWKSLVGSGKPYDFKVDSSTMLNPKSASCPDADCSGTITLCPGSKGLNCYGKDLPGNIFYATIGNFVGFSENTLQLGSQFAQLSSTQTWDPPEDTQMISFGFNLPSFSRSSFCAALQGAKASFPQKSCADCQEAASASIIDPK
ncbi:MAG TPA: DUF4157 domain-containing protein [Pyrinomonadaceae bacterium]|nr:DUF4157 domain-containing protein [Pyrinomonadaceae bacterium]